jgi:preprotein translocase subunit SecD
VKRELLNLLNCYIVESEIKNVDKTVGIIMKRILQLLTVCLLTVVAVAADSAKVSMFQIRLVLDKSSVDSEQMTEQLKKSKDSNQTFPVILNVQKKALLDQTDVKSAAADVLGKYHIVKIVFTADGQKKFAAITRQHIGDSLAIIVDGTIVVTFQVDAEKTEGKLDFVSRFMTEQEAKQIADEINSAAGK